MLALVLLVPAAALAAGYSMPKPASSKLVVPTSLAGIKLGQAEGQAKAAWGNRGHCEDSNASGRSGCEYGDTEGANGYAYIEFNEGRVLYAVIYGGVNAGNERTPKAGAALANMKTASGIGIGSTYSALKAAYPKGKKVVTSASSEAFNYSIESKAGNEFNFGVLSNSKKVYAVAIVGQLPK
jgi:hypothetical protein